jgi:Fuc2NAc and GlcNAc transferase
MILDIPNNRSSHTIPTPRGGGLAIIISFYIGVIFLSNIIDTNLLLALFSSIPIVIVGIIDDMVTLSSKIRIVVQGFSAILGLYFLGGVHSIDFIFFEINGSWVNILAFISIIWIINFYNFLDGIDGYAGSETVFIGVSIFILFNNPLGLIIAVSTLGFLFFNWDKASIFMGDVGSTTIGFIFAILIFWDTSEGNIYIWLVLLSLFWFDATYTIIRRYINGEKITEAHNKHLFQRLVQSGWSHQRVVINSIIINIIFLIALYYLNHILVFIINIIFMALIIYLINKKRDFNAST